MKDDFFNRIIYSSSNEDGCSERTALRSSKKILCLTGSGARPLELLSDNVERIVSIDSNPRQNYLLELKLASIRNLPYDAFLAFIGVRDSSDRISVYGEFSDNLSPDAKQFWDANTRMIEDGVIYCGVWDSLLRLFAKFSNTRRKKRDILLSIDSLEQQSAYWDREWKGIIWNSLLKGFSIRWLWKYIFREPGIYYVPKQFRISKYLSCRFDAASKNILFSGSPFAWQIFSGKYNFQRCLPWHLQEASYPIIKRNISKIEIVSESLQAHLDSYPDRYDGGSLSDFSSYCSENEYGGIWRSIGSTFRANSVVCERHFLVKRDPLPYLSVRATRDFRLEQQLEKTDTSFIYTFCIVNTPPDSQIQLECGFG